MGRNCTVCRSSERKDIDAALRASIPYRDIARQHHLSKDAIARHRGNHLTRDEEQLGTRPALAEIIAGCAQAVALLDQAQQAETWQLTMLKVREARGCVERAWAVAEKWPRQTMAC
jgi:hypothetical protein